MAKKSLFWSKIFVTSQKNNFELKMLELLENNVRNMFVCFFFLFFFVFVFVFFCLFVCFFFVFCFLLELGNIFENFYQKSKKK